MDLPPPRAARAVVPERLPLHHAALRLRGGHLAAGLLPAGAGDDRLAAPRRVRAEDPRRGPAGALEQGRHADHGRPAGGDRDRRAHAAVGELPLAPDVAGPAGHGVAGGAGLPRRLPARGQGVPQGPAGPLQAGRAGADRPDRRAGAGDVARAELVAARPRPTETHVPFLKFRYLDFGLLFVPFVILVITASSNAVNLTDGLDGLASGLVAVAALAFTGMCYVTATRASAST